jgi:hypothetical protein
MVGLSQGERSWGSSVGIVAKLRTSLVETTNFSHLQNVQTGRGAHPALLFNGYRSSLRGLKRPGRKADHSQPSSADVIRTQAAVRVVPHVMWCLCTGRSLRFYLPPTSVLVCLMYLPQAVSRRPLTADGGGPFSIQRHSVCDFWWTHWQFCNSQYVGFPLSVPFHQCPIPTFC